MVEQKTEKKLKKNIVYKRTFRICQQVWKIKLLKSLCPSIELSGPGGGLGGGGGAESEDKT